MIIDKSKEVKSYLTLSNGKVQFRGEVEGNNPVLIDYIPPVGDNLGYTSLELFLLSLSSCLGTAILVLLRRMNKNVESFLVESSGTRKNEHPTGFKSISMLLILNSENLSSEEMHKVIKMAEPICPVISMIKEQVEIKIDFRINS